MGWDSPKGCSVHVKRIGRRTELWSMLQVREKGVMWNKRQVSSTTLACGSCTSWNSTCSTFYATFTGNRYKVKSSTKSQCFATKATASTSRAASRHCWHRTLHLTCSTRQCKTNLFAYHLAQRLPHIDFSVQHYKFGAICLLPSAAHQALTRWRCR